MKQRKMRKSLIVVTCIFVLSMVLAACGGKNNDASGGSAAPSGSAGSSAPASGEKKKVTVWYLWGGAEGKALEQVIEDFNKSQDKYVAEGLSVPDEQKIKVAIAGGNGPDITDSFDWAIPQYAQQGIALPLDDLIARDGYDMSDFIPAALESGKFDGKQYAFPLNVSFSMMYYNKKLLADAGFTEPPKTSKELFDVAVKTTKTNANGSIEILGFPSYPSEKYIFNTLAYAYGSTYVNSDATQLTLDNPGTLEAAKQIYDYTKQFGPDNIKQIQASGKWLDPTDPFMTGKQAIRFDGPWLSAQIKSQNIQLDYGIAPVPYMDGKPETAGSGLNSSSIFYITKTSKNVDGAWEFMKFLYSTDEMAKFLSALGNMPAKKSAIEHDLIKNMPDYAQIAELSKSPNLKSIPNFAKRADFDKAMNEEVEKLSFAKATPEEIVKEMVDRTKDTVK